MLSELHPRALHSPARSSLVPATRLTHHTSHITHHTPPRRAGSLGRTRHDRRGASCSSRRAAPALPP
eukprot:6562830-Prymnesium_polylepis.1